MKFPILSATLSALLLAGCGAGDGSSTSASDLARDEFDTAAMLVNLADNVFIPAYESFQQAATLAAANTGAINSYCGAIGTAQEATALSAAQQEWRDLMALWQPAELFILGPTADNSSALRNQIYSFGAEATSSCFIDQGVVLEELGSLSLATRPIGSRGLDALEYLLFNSNLDHTCPVTITETQTWNTLADDARKAQRCNYASVLLDEINTAATAINTAWAPAGEDFRSAFINPVNLSSSLSAVSDALFFVDIDLKDAKLASPLGRVGCTPVDCSPRGDVEAPYSNNSLTNIDANLVSFLNVFNGDAGQGFDDLIASVGQDQLNAEFSNAVAAARANVVALAGTDLATAAAAVSSAQDIAECEMAIAAPANIGSHVVCNLFGNVKTISDLLKTDFILATALDIPERAAGDAD